MVYHKTINGILSSMKGGSVKELKLVEDTEEKIIQQDKNSNISIIPQKHIKENKISQEKLNRFVNLKLKF
jgi:hypothetical protein